MDNRKRLLFLCTGNSCRSQMAEGILNNLASERFIAFSAGSKPASEVNPIAIRTMKDMGIDISNKTSKSLDIYVNDPWDIIITVCDNAKEACPVFPGQKIGAHWSFEDPAEFVGTEYETKAFYRKIALEIEQRIRLFLALPENVSQPEYERSVKNIGLQ